MTTLERPPVVFEDLSVERRRLSLARTAAVIAAALASTAATLAAILALIPSRDGEHAALATALATSSSALWTAALVSVIASLVSLRFAFGARRASARVIIGEAGVTIERGDRVE